MFTEQHLYELRKINKNCLYIPSASNKQYLYTRKILEFFCLALYVYQFRGKIKVYIFF